MIARPGMSFTEEIPEQIRADLRRAIRLEWWTLGLMAAVTVMMGFAMGGSQAMKTAWIEDMLSLVAPIVFLIAVRMEGHPPTRRFPFGFDRVHSLVFLIAAVALATIGGTLLWDAGMTLAMGERPTVSSVELFGREIWHGWIMIAAQIISVIPPIILGRLKLPLADRLHDKVLQTDAMTQKADWMTGLAGLGGVIGLGLGYWWADAVAAGLISLSILHDGLKMLRIATAELVDGAPRDEEGKGLARDAEALQRALEQRFPGGDVRLRETGRRIQAQIEGCPAPDRLDIPSLWPGKREDAWRLERVSFVPPGEERTDGD